MGEFYRYISRRDKKYGKEYEIIKNGISFGSYSDIRAALHDRDLYENSNWDIAEALARDETPNKYLDMEIPSFDEYLERKKNSKYITYQKSGHKEYYTVQKTINGTQKRFGYFDTFEEAVNRRDELIKKNWGLT